MSRDASAARRVGALLVVAFAVAALAVFVLGDRRSLFSLKRTYFSRFDDVNGLETGAAVQLAGVRVGSVAEIVLPVDMGLEQLEVRFTVEARYRQRIRGDSRVRIKTLGLLGDKYVEITSGTPTFPEIANDGEIPAAPQADVDRLAARGEDVVNNIAIVSRQLAEILGRMERGEGILGELTKDIAPGRKLTTELLESLDALQRVVLKVDRGEGTLGRLVQDPTMADQLAATVGRIDALSASAERGEGLLGALLSDPEQKDRLTQVLERLDRAAAQLERFADSLTGSQALLPRLFSDEAYGAEMAADLKTLVDRLTSLAEKLDRGQGTLGKLIEDPALYEAIQDVVVGVDESKLLSWLVKNRQKTGIEKRYEAAQEPPKSPADSPPVEPKH